MPFPVLRHCLAVLAVSGVALPSIAEEQWLTPREFEARITDQATKVFDEYGDLFGIEYFLPDRRVIWQFAGDDSCMNGKWRPKDGAICYSYEGGDVNCLRYFPDGERLTGVEWDDGQPSGDTYVLVVVADPAPACGTS